MRDAINDIDNMTPEEKEEEQKIQMSQIEASPLTVNHTLGTVSGEFDPDVYPWHAAHVHVCFHCMTCCVKCNTCITLCGTPQQAISAGFYICKYCSDPEKASGNGHVSTIMYSMDKHAEQRESVAPDAATSVTREMQFKMTMMTNLFVSGIAMSDTQAGGKVLNNKSEYSSHKFWNVYTEALRKWQRKSHPRDEQQVHDAELDEQKADEVLDEVNMFEDAGELICGTEFDTSVVTEDKDGNKKVKGMTHQHINYIYRGEALGKMCPLEYNVMWSRCVVLT